MLNLVGDVTRTDTAPPMVRTARAPAHVGDAADRLHRQLGDDLAAVFAFLTPEARFDEITTALADFNGAVGVCCTTAGEIDGGYLDGEIVAMGLPRRNFDVATVTVPDLDDINAHSLIRDVIRTRHALESKSPAFKHEFAFLVVDGTSTREDTLMDALAHALGPVPVFGGSAGDGTRFEESLIGLNGEVLRRAAVLTFVRTDCPVKVFSFHHLAPGERRMVVTGADPSERLVTHINAEPAAQEYARVLRKDPANLDPFTFAAHPLVVRVGGQHYVRSIQRITDEGHLKFFSAIDEGVVLTLADLKDIATELEKDLTEIRDGQHLEGILACDCVLRRIAAEQTQRTRDVGEVLARHRVIGFSTYGEQFGAMHVNLTMTGVAIFRPPDRPEDARAD